MNRFACVHVRLAFWALALVMLAAVWGGWASQLRAQQDAPAVEAADAGVVPDAPEAGDAVEEKADADEDPIESLGNLIFKRPTNLSEWVAFGFYMTLALFSIVGMAVTLERLARLHRGRVMPERFVKSLRNLIGRKEDSLDNFRTLCDRKKSPVASILKAGVLRAGRPLPEVEKAMEDAAAREMAAMRSRNRPLSVVGSVAPLVGLLGTVVGMIFAFKVSSQAGLGKAELLAEGIYMALLTTAAGLTIAIPCLLLVAWFNALVERFMRDIDETLLETMPSFARMENSNGDNLQVVPRPETATAGKS